MRWSNLEACAEQRARLPGYRGDAIVRHFDAPEALETNFYEVRARSILNRVPEASQVPFRWTINPYRGCTHACAYCLGPDTAVLLADGLTKPIADVQIGERIYGTVRDGSERRLTITSVLDKWSRSRPGYAVELEDGTQLIASDDHRFLSRCGWKYVAGSGAGGGRRPHLAVGTELMGIGGVVEPPVHGDDYRRGGLRGCLCAPERSLEGRALEPDATLAVKSIRHLGIRTRMYDITTGTGDFIANGVVSHNCFARPTHTYLDFSAGRDFEREIVVKVNAPELLRVELARPSWKGEQVALGTNTDPYQWVEGRYRLMQGIWEAMRDARNPCSILTKSPLLLRDLSLMQQIAERTEFSAALSVPTIDERAWRATEPHTPNPRARLEAVAELTRAGIRTGVLVAPLMPGINDSPEQVARILELATAAGASYITGIALHLRGEVKGLFTQWLKEHRPDLLPRYRQLYRRGAYAIPEERERLARLVRGPEREPGERRRGRMLDVEPGERKGERVPDREPGERKGGRAPDGEPRALRLF